MKVRYAVLGLFLSACSTGSKIAGTRDVLDSSYRGKEAPQWVVDGKVTWEENSSLYLKSMQTVRGDQRLSACYDLAKMEAKETLLSEIQSVVKGEVNQANQGIDEIDPIALNKMLQKTIDGSIRRLRVREVAFERYQVNNTERIDCFVLLEMKNSDYQKMKTTLGANMRALDDEVAKALKNRQVRFFDGESGGVRAPASLPQKVKVAEDASNKEAQ